MEDHYDLWRRNNQNRPLIDTALMDIDISIIKRDKIHMNQVIDGEAKCDRQTLCRSPDCNSQARRISSPEAVRKL